MVHWLRNAKYAQFIGNFPIDISLTIEEAKLAFLFPAAEEEKGYFTMLESME